jgi:hypothetical protein
MIRPIVVTIAVSLLAACGSDTRPVNIPEVAPGASEAACQQLCTRADGDDGCTAKHAEFCVASCRVRTNGMTAACADCLVAAGEPIHGAVDAFDEPFCVVGGPAALGACTVECDDSGAAPPAASLATLCDLECGFYMQDPTPLACTADGSADCQNQCAAAVAGRGRVCAQCVIEQVIPSMTCINDECDCDPFFVDDPSGTCDTLCDDQPPSP